MTTETPRFTVTTEGRNNADLILKRYREV